MLYSIDLPRNEHKIKPLTNAIVTNNTQFLQPLLRERFCLGGGGRGVLVKYQLQALARRGERVLLLPVEDGGHEGEEDDGDGEEEARQEERHVEGHRVAGAPLLAGVDGGRDEGGHECDEEQALKF